MKKILTLLLSIALMISLIPTTALALEDGDELSETSEHETRDAGLKVMYNEYDDDDYYDDDDDYYDDDDDYYDDDDCEHDFEIEPSEMLDLGNGNWMCYEGYIGSCIYCGFDDEGWSGYFWIEDINIPNITYNGKSQKPKVRIIEKYEGDDEEYVLDAGIDYDVYYSNNKNVGKGSAKIVFDDEFYNGAVKIPFIIKPTPTSITKLSKGTKSFTVKWKKKSTQVTGYQIQYATNSKFSNAKTVNVKSYKTTSKKITKLAKKKNYYVRVRTYKTVSGNKYYSNWSSTKKVKTK